MTEKKIDPLADRLPLKDYGWNPHFERQIANEERDVTRPVRVLAVHRDSLEVAGPAFAGRVTPLVGEVEDVATVGDWLLIEADVPRAIRVLERRSIIKRKAAGTARRTQLLAANVDTLILVTSANQDFNTARLERYLALAAEAEVMPVLVITKADLVEDIARYTAEARLLMPGLVVEAFDARSDDALACLRPWFAPGQTLALLGSSGVGKSTIVNSVSGNSLQITQGIREDDAHGRHTTSGRSLHRLPSGAWLMDTPGMRELQILDVADGLNEVFADVAELAAACRFSDCAHVSEPGCAIQAAIVSGALEPDRLKRYQKLQREGARAGESIAEAHARNQRFGRMAKATMANKRKTRGW